MQNSVYSFFLVGLGGALGAMSRYALTVVSSHYNSFSIAGTLLSNTIGCFLMGVIIQLVFNLSSNTFTEGLAAMHVAQKSSHK